FAAVLGVLAILFMLHTPVTFAVDHVLPGLSSFKPLGRAAFLLQFALAVLAAFGIETVLHSRWPLIRSRRVVSRAARLVPLFGMVLVALVAGSIVSHEWLWKRIVMLPQQNRARFLYSTTPLIRYL